MKKTLGFEIVTHTPFSPMSEMKIHSFLGLPFVDGFQFAIYSDACVRLHCKYCKITPDREININGFSASFQNMSSQICRLVTTDNWAEQYLVWCTSR